MRRLALCSLLSFAYFVCAQQQQPAPQQPLGDIYESGSGAETPAQAVQKLYNLAAEITADPSSGYDAQSGHWPEEDAAWQQWDNSTGKQQTQHWLRAQRIWAPRSIPRSVATGLRFRSRTTRRHRQTHRSFWAPPARTSRSANWPTPWTARTVRLAAARTRPSREAWEPDRMTRPGRPAEEVREHRLQPARRLRSLLASQKRRVRVRRPKRRRQRSYLAQLRNLATSRSRRMTPLRSPNCVTGWDLKAASKLAR